MNGALLLSLLLSAAPVLSDESPQAAAPIHVEVVTSHGNITLELYPDKAPATVENFLGYVRSGHYEDTIFHRVVRDFVVQGGSCTSDLTRKRTRAAIEPENSGLRNQRGTIAMARRPRSGNSTSDFFINVTDNRFLDRDRALDGIGYTVFGRVTDGMDVVDRISRVRTRVRSVEFPHVPVRSVTIRSTRVVQPRWKRPPQIAGP